MTTQKIFSVSELTSAIRNMLEQRYRFISVAGEITNLRRPGSGHCYFTLKDDRAQIKAVLFGMQRRYLAQPPKDGQMVICQGRISVYEPRGDYQLIVDTMDFHGAGALQLAFEQLKSKLNQEGLFDSAHKKPIPSLPRHITLVTSASGAAVHDFIRLAASRYPQLHLAVYPVAVQGDQAAAEICQAIKDLNDNKATECIVLTRGGGSIEDLWAFNDEQLAHVIHDSALPVVSAVGHEIDFTIADFVADLRAPTPSGAAEMILPDSSGLVERIADLSKRLDSSLNSQLNEYSSRLMLYQHQLASATRPIDNLMLRLDHYRELLEHAIHTRLLTEQSRLSEVTNRLHKNTALLNVQLYPKKIQAIQQRFHQAMEQTLHGKTRDLLGCSNVLDAVSPLATLGRGYAIARKKSREKAIISQTSQVRQGENIEVILAQGKLDCLIDAVQENNRSENKL